MDFFNDTAANCLQQVAVIFEASGLALVFLEMFYSEKARAIENYIQRIRKPTHAEKTHWAFGKRQRLYHSTDPFCLLWMVIGALPGAALALFFSNFFFSTWWGWILFVALFFILWVPTFYVAIIAWQIGYEKIFVWFILYPIRLAIRTSNKIAKDHPFGALGALGLLLAILGTTCELYQLLELCESEGCYYFIQPW